ncbi:hypothetical protein [Paraburkholderia phenazinium]|jgi:hypothetical protein|uniref:DUF5666 domain-containing protein n=1 Tax=Paraburkholderia phenazinium TaxID=60549 RepID=A0A1G7ZTE7_9BURK|nr:hypothetical protein [Paraburkholderia phenazinium]SDH11897.1 hypothetical protein SAMN05216466_107165 [Paraburkholderia phenazinium]
MFYQSNGRSSVAKRYVAIAVVLGLSSWVSVCAAADNTASEPASASQSDKTVDHESGAVTFIDTKNSIIVVTVDGGQELSLNAKDHTDVLDRVHVGDKIAISYLEPYVTGLTRDKGARLTRVSHTVKVTQSTAGADEDGFHAVRTYDGIVEVTAINKKLDLLTIVDASGAARSIKVSQPDLVSVMNSLVRHDHVHIVYESAFTVSITH